MTSEHRQAGRLDGKTAVITAAGQGMGRAAALAFLREGAEVWATDIDAAKLETLAGHAGVKTFVLDVLDPQQIEAFARKVAAPDILFTGRCGPDKGPAATEGIDQTSIRIAV